MTTFVLVIFFLETTRGYALTNVPGYKSKAACEAGAAALEKPGNSYSILSAQCIPGPRR